MNYKEDGTRRGYEPEVYSQIFEKEEAKREIPSGWRYYHIIEGIFIISEIHRESCLETEKAVEQKNDVIVNDVSDLWRQRQEEEKQRFGNYSQTVSSSLHGNGIDYNVLQRFFS